MSSSVIRVHRRRRIIVYDLEVTKTAVESFNRDFDWTIEKTVDPTSLDLFHGDSDTVEWTVTWTKGDADDFGYAVEGEITIVNNHPSGTESGTTDYSDDESIDFTGVNRP